MSAVRSTGAWVVAGGAMVLAGCALYRPKPLPSSPDLAPAPAIIVPASDLGLPGLRAEPFDPAKGLSETNVVTLAVLANPQLVAARRGAGVADAQSFAAGLLPDPQLSGGISKSALFTGYSAALTQDLAALVTHAAAKRAAKAHARQVRLDILWQEWQVAARARELYIEATALAQLRVLLDARRESLAKLYHHDADALARHDLSVRQVSGDLSAWDSAEADWRVFELRQTQNRHALDALLGLAPTVRLRLNGGVGEADIDAARYRAALAQLPRRRPDLLALRAGYRSAEERLREEILAQFPVLGVGVVKARSAEEGVQSTGFDVSLTLPIFNRNRGRIAVARASRAYLYQSYQARLDESASQADALWSALRIMQRQAAALDARRAGMARAVAAAARGLADGAETLTDYTRLDSDALAVEIEFIELRESVQRARAALSTLLALPLRAER